MLLPCLKTLELKSFFAEAYNNLGNAFKSLYQFDAATKSYQRALESRPLLAEDDLILNLTERRLSHFNRVLQTLY
tara:strand:- start:984 stop:1208 length:225 start_codon:yes stop_codon:yes gene_type:complete